MPVFEYQAYDSTGRTRRGVIDADSARPASLRRQGSLALKRPEENGKNPQSAKGH